MYGGQSRGVWGFQVQCLGFRVLGCFGDPGSKLHYLGFRGSGAIVPLKWIECGVSGDLVVSHILST